jgi:hypothetical protein
MADSLPPESLITLARNAQHEGASLAHRKPFALEIDRGPAHVTFYDLIPASFKCRAGRGHKLYKTGD